MKLTERLKGYLQRLASGLTAPTVAKLRESLVAKQVQLHSSNRLAQLLLSRSYRDVARGMEPPLDFDDVGFNVFSQTYEDGILLYIFSIIGVERRKCVDIGASGIINSNVANLVVNHGLSALLIDGDEASLKRAEQYYSSHRETQLFPPKFAQELVTAENVNDILSEHGFLGEIDLLCIDIDGMDYWIWRAIDVIRPRVVVVEYQDALGPDRAWTVPYRPDFDLNDYAVNRQGFNYCGASLGAFVKLGKEKGYRLVGCSRGGWNAFFMLDGIGEAHLKEVPPAACFRYEWNENSIRERFPKIEGLDWVEV
jgi:hypothetical protein